MKALIVICAMLAVLASNAEASKCNLRDGMVYIAFFGGARDDKPKLVYRTADKWRHHYEQYVVKYYTWNQATIATNELIKMLEACPHKYSKIVLIGHSWGGETAYAVAEALDDHSVALVTLDPVGRRGWNTHGLWPIAWLSAQHNRMPNPTTRRGIWVNVHAQSSGETDIGFFPLFLVGFVDFLYHARCDAIAWAGGPWGRQGKADQDYVLAPAAFDDKSIILTHCHVGRMLSQSFRNTAAWGRFFQQHKFFPIPEYYPEDE